MLLFRPCRTALGLLSRHPGWLHDAHEPEALSDALVCLPFAGLILGSFLTGMHQLLNPVLPAYLEATLLLIPWMLLSGGQGPAALAHQVQRRPLNTHSDPIDQQDMPPLWPASILLTPEQRGQMTLILTLLTKWALLLSVIQLHQSWLLLVTPAAGQIAALGLFLIHPLNTGPFAPLKPYRPTGLILLWLAWLLGGLLIGFGLLPLLMLLILWTLTAIWLRQPRDSLSLRQWGSMLEIMENAFMLILITQV